MINNNQIINQFNGIRLATDKEKEQYIKCLKGNNISFTLLNIFAKFWIFIGIFGAIGIITNHENFGTRLFMLLIVCAIGIFGWIINKKTKENIALPRKATNGKLYIADCYSYDKKITNSSRSRRFYIKVTDNVDCYLDKWFSIDHISFVQNDVIKAKLFVVKNENEYFFDVYTESIISKWK